MFCPVKMIIFFLYPVLSQNSKISLQCIQDMNHIYDYNLYWSFIEIVALKLLQLQLKEYLEPGLSDFLYIYFYTFSV